MDICMLTTMDDDEVNKKPSENCIRSTVMCRVVFSSVLGKHCIAAVPGGAHSQGVSCQSPACPILLSSRSSCSFTHPVCWWQGLGTAAILMNEGIQIITLNSWRNRKNYQGKAGDGGPLTCPCELGTEGQTHSSLCYHVMWGHSLSKRTHEKHGCEAAGVVGSRQPAHRPPHPLVQPS